MRRGKLCRPCSWLSKLVKSRSATSHALYACSFYVFVHILAAVSETLEQANLTSSS